MNLSVQICRDDLYDPPNFIKKLNLKLSETTMNSIAENPHIYQFFITTLRRHRGFNKGR